MAIIAYPARRSGDFPTASSAHFAGARKSYCLNAYKLLHLIEGPVAIYPAKFPAASQLFSTTGLSVGRPRTRMAWTVAGMIAISVATTQLRAQQQEPARQLVREVVYNELHNHQTHGYWRYWIQQHAENDTKLEEEVETTQGPVARVVQENGRPVDAQSQHEEQVKLEKLVSSPQEIASHRQAYIEDEKHITLVLSMLPDAYEFEYAGDENGCHHLRYRPSSSYNSHTIEGRVIHSMSGDLWIDARMKRLSRLEGRLNDNVDFGFGLLGRLNKGGWFRMQRTQVSSTDWKTQGLEVHLSGRAVLFKSIGRETSELRGGYIPVPSDINLAQGIKILNETDPNSPPSAVARITPVSFNKHR